MFMAYKYFGLSIGGLYSPQYMGEPWTWDKFVDMLGHLPIPVLIIGLSGTAGLIRVLRGTLLDEIHKPYVDTARAKGVERERPAAPLSGAHRHQPPDQHDRLAAAGRLLRRRPLSRSS